MASLEFEDVYAKGTHAFWSSVPLGSTVPVDKKTLTDMSIRELVRATAETWRLMYLDFVDRRPVEAILRPERRAHVGLTVSFVSILLLVLINGDRR